MEKERFQIICERAPFAYLVIAEDGTFEHVNPTSWNYSGTIGPEIPNGREWFRLHFQIPLTGDSLFLPGWSGIAGWNLSSFHPGILL